MEGIRAARLSQEPAILLLTSAGSQMERERGGLGGERVGACFFGEGTKELPWVGRGSFCLFHGSQSPTVFPRRPRGEKWRQIHGWFFAKTLHDVLLLCFFFSPTPTDRPILFQVFIEKSLKGEFCLIHFVSREWIVRDYKKKKKAVGSFLQPSLKSSRLWHRVLGATWGFGWGINSIIC